MKSTHILAQDSEHSSGLESSLGSPLGGQVEAISKLSSGDFTVEPDPTLKPQPKVVAGGMAGAVTAIILWMLSSFARVDVPAEVAAAITTMISFVMSYITSNK